MDFASRRNRTLLLAATTLGLASAVTCAKGPRPPGEHARSRAVLATIDGRVVAGSGLPVADATVVLESDDDAAAAVDPGAAGDHRSPSGADRLERIPVAAVRSSAEGWFHVANVPAGRYRLRAHAPDYADGRVPLNVHARESLTTLVRLEQAEMLAGQIVDRRGQPIPGARVLVSALVGAPGRPREATSDEAGRFAVGGLTRGAHRLIAEAAGFGSVEQGPIEIPAAAILLRMQADGHSLIGLVSSAAGQPIAGARVIIGGENLSPSRETTTRTDGGFVFNGLGIGAYVLRASRAGDASPLSDEVIVDRSGDSLPVVRLALAPGWIVAGRVVDDSGRPLPGAEIRVDARIDSGADDPLPRVVHPDGHGDWHAGPLPAGEYRFTPRQPGFIARRPVQLRVGADGDAASAVQGRPQILELVRGADIVGRVVDGAGAAVRDAIVRCRVPGRDDLAVIADRLPLAAEAAELPSGSGHAVGRTRSVATDAAGRFELADILPGRVFVEVSREGSVPRRSAGLALHPGQSLDLGALSIESGVRLVGRVVDDRDAPVDGARVAVVAANASAGHLDPEIVVVTDGAGQFLTSVAPGAHRLRVSAAGMQENAVTVQVTAIAPPSLTVRLQRADASLEGAVRDGVGRPIARARVVAWPVSSAAAGPGVGMIAGAPIPDGVSPLASTVTDPGGHFALTRLPRGAILVEVKHPDYPPTIQTVDVASTPRASLTITVPIPGGVEGDVHEKVTGAVISTYRIEARGPEGRIVGATRRSGAGFLLARLLPGRWTLDVHAPGYASAQTVVDVPATSTLGESSVRDLRVEITPTPRN